MIVLYGLSGMVGSLMRDQIESVMYFMLNYAYNVQDKAVII